MKQRRIGRSLNYRTVTILVLLLALVGCTMPLPVATPGATPEGTAAATEPLTDTQSSPAGELPTDGGDQMAERVEFEPDTTTATLSGTLTAGSDKQYALAASAGQTVTVAAVGDEGPVNFTVYGPGSTSWSGESQADADNRVMTQVVAPENGDYLVTLSVPTDGAETSYEVTFIVEPNAVARIAFPGGETTTERSGSLPSGAIVQQYLLSANTGMTLTVDATSDAAPLSMTIESPSGNQRIPEMMPADDGYTIGHQFVLPEPGYYLVTLAKGDEAPATNYTVTFTLVSTAS